MAVVQYNKPFMIKKKGGSQEKYNSQKVLFK